MATTLATYYQRLLNKTQFVNLHGIPYPRDRSGRSRALKVPLDNVYIQIQAIANKERKREEKAEEEHIAGQMREREEWLEEEQMAGEAHERERIVEEEQSEAQRHDKEALGIDKLLSAIRTLGEYLYRRGQVYEATARPEPVDPQAALQEHKRLVILGAPGSGKSTLLRYLARRAAEKSGGRLPILLSLRDYAAALAQDESLLLQEFALRQAAAGDAQLYQILSSAIESGEREPLWLMDALDEARNWAEHAARQASRLPGQLILTSRPIGYVGTGLTSLPHFEILPLTATNVDQFLQDWFAFLAHEENTNPEAVAKQVSSLKEQLEQRPRLKPLASNPLLLTFLVILYGENPTQALPHQRAELYRRYVEELLDRWESSRGQQHAGRGESIFQLLPERDARQAALDGFHYLGWRLHLTYYGGQGKQAPNKTTLVSALSNYLRPKWDTQAEIIAPAIFEFWQQAGLLDLWTIAGTEYLAFRHLTFQEYAAAWGIAQAWRRHPKRAWHFLRPRLHHYAWREPILLLVGILKEEHLNELVRRILRARSPYERSLHRDLRLAGGLLAEGAMLSKQLTQRIIGSFKQLRWNYDDAKKLGGLTWLLIYLLGLFVLNLLWPLWSGLIVAILCILCSFAWWGSFLAFEFLNIRLFLAVRLSIGTYIANRKPVIPLLQQIGTLALPALFHMSQDSDSYVRLATANALGEATPVPYLITTLFDSDWRAHQAAANALGQIGEAAAVPHLINALSDSESHVREEAANALGQIGEAAAVPHLINALSDSDGSVRWRAVKALGQIGEAAAVFHLIRALSDSNWHVREAAAKALGQIGEAAAVPHLITALSDSDRDMRKAAANALGQIGEAAVSHLISALSDSSWHVRKNAANALVQIGKAAAVPHLITLLSHSDGNMRQEAAQALGQIGEAAAVPHLITALSDSDSSVRQAATNALGQIGEAAAGPHLIRALSDRDKYVRWEAVNALGHIGEAAVPHLITALSDSDGDVRGKAANALGQIGEAAAVPDLITALSDSHWRVCREAANALGKIGKAAAVPDLISALSDSYWGVRSAAANALGQIEEAAAVPDLISALSDRDWHVRRQAANALGQIGEAAAVPDLISALSDRDWRVRWRAANALGQIGEAAAVPDLISALSDRDWRVRSAVANALEEIVEVKEAAALPHLITALKNTESNVRRDAAKTLGRLAKVTTDPKHLKQAAKALWWRLVDEKSVAETAFDALEQVVERLTILEVEARPIEDPLMEP